MHFEGIITSKYKMDSTNCKRNSQSWPAQQELAADALQRPLRSRLWARLKLRVSAPSEAWRFLKGSSPFGVRPNQPLLTSVAPANESEDRRTTQVKRTQGTT
jgi:hypothetical protein